MFFSSKIEEKLQLTQERYIRAWDESMQNQYHQFMSLTPLRMTEKQLTLVVCLSRAGEATLKHPLMVRLEQQVSNLDKFIRTPKIDEEKLLDVRVVDREEAAAEIQFDHASKLQWPDHLSPTSITTPKEIAERLKEYDAVYKELVEAKGAILQLAENKLTEKLLHEQLRSCLDSLLEILKDNEQKVLHQFARYFDLREMKDFRPTSSIDYNVWQGHLKAIIGYATNYEIDDFSRSEEESLSFIRCFVRE